MLSAISTHRPFVIGVIVSALFFALYFAVAGTIGWQNPAPWESAIGEASRWCERVAPGAFREPVNALSNIGFMVAGLWMLRVLGRDEQLGRTRAGLIGFSPTATGENTRRKAPSSMRVMSRTPFITSSRVRLPS